MSERTVASVMKQGADRLVRCGLADPVGDAQRLMAHALDTDRAGVMSRADTPVTPAEMARFFNAVDERELRVPVSQIIGRRAFWKHEFHVTRAVLDPRPDTEALVEEALKASFERVLDLGTGSGCILLSLLAERAGAQGVGVDCSAAALKVARLNAAELSLEARVDFLQSDWFQDVRGRFDLIVSNPPYITAEAFEELEPEVREHEPKIALTPGDDGLAAYRTITAEAPGYLNPGGALMVEIGFDQGAAVCGLFEEADFVDIRVIADLNGKDRVVRGLLALK